ncbi:MAG TPA: choice-of-anchor E domain-containing protein, partial [Gemmatales bacterium]|nr:choice-of-anchor E domain-containing protein [Gemmatales bacterium]
MAWSWRRWLRRLFLEPLEDRTVPASISGYVYHDLNGNGLRDPGEPAIANNLIELRNSQGNLISTTTTNQNGFYQFTTDQSVNSSLQSQVQSFSFADANTNSIRQHSIQQFNPALGTLQSVEIRVDGRILSTIRLENLDNASAHVTGTVSGSLLLSGPGFNLNVQANGNAAIRQNLAAYDGTLDYAGSSGITLVNRSATGSQTQTIQGSNLSNFIGSGTVSFSFLAQATTEATGGGNLMANITNLGGADVTVTYKYLNNNSLKPGQYTIIQKNQPTGFLDGRESQGGAVVPNSINTDKLFVQLGTAASVENNFGEYSPARVSGFVYHDANNNGLKEATERFFSNIPVTLTGINDIGQSIQIAGRTDNNGHYNFGNLRPGQYTVTQN